MSGSTMEAPAIDTCDITFREVSIEMLRESPHNPRRRFDPAALEQLQESLARSGMLTPIRVRSMEEGTFLIASGHRRYRAALSLGWTMVPVLESEMTDAQFLEVMTVDNLQRDDLHPMEEARGFALLIKELGYDIAQVAHRVGRSSSYVYDRVRLLKLTPLAQELFSADRFPLSHAIVLSRLAPTGQELVIGTLDVEFADGGLFREDAVRGEEQLDWSGPEMPEDVLDRLIPVSLRQLENWVESNVRFDREATDLVDLFPETAEQIAAALAAKGKVIPITFEHTIRDSARAEERTLGPRSFREASGRGKETPTCEHAVLGVVMVGHRRGESFPICIAKEKCTVHYAKEIRERKSREKERASAEATGTVDKQKAKEAKRAAAEQAKREALDELARQLKTGRPALEARVRQAVAMGPMRALARVILRPELDGKEGKQLDRDLKAGKYDQPDAIVRAYVTSALVRLTYNHWDWNELVEEMKYLGVDAVAVLDAAVPPTPKVEPKPKAKPAPAKGKAKKSKKRLVGDVRRSKAKAAVR